MDPTTATSPLDRSVLAGAPERNPKKTLPGEPALGWSDVLGPHAANPPQPRTTGCELIVEDDGAEWPVPPAEHGIKGQFEDYLRRQAWMVVLEADRLDQETAALARAAGVSVPTAQLQYERTLALYMRNRAAGHYTWLGEVAEEARATGPGIIQLLHLLLLRARPAATLDDAERLYCCYPNQANAALGAALKNLFPPRRGARAEVQRTDPAGSQPAQPQSPRQGSPAEGTLSADQPTLATFSGAVPTGQPPPPPSR